MESASFSGTNLGLQVGINHGNIYSLPGLHFFNTSPYRDYKEINPSRVKDTGRWFIDHPIFQKWKTSSHDDLLWLSADPGCGKSVLSKALIDDRLVDDGSATICYFFFKDNEEQNNTATAICALLHQLFCAQPDLFQKHAEDPVRQHGEKIKEDFSSLWQLWISATFASTRDVICILDALDECRHPDRDRLIKELERFYTRSQERGQTKSRVKFLVTSRPYGDIEWGFGELTHRYPTIRLAADDEWKKISEEIQVVMEAKVDEIVEKRRLSNQIRKGLKRRFAQIPSRTYLWLYLTLDVLKTCLGQTEKKLLRRINELPKNVEQAYEEILQRCDDENKEDGRRLLEIVVAAPRPLTLSEIDVALEIQKSSRRYDELDLEGILERRKWIRDACGLFVSIIESRVYLIHQTAREFLLRQAGESVSIGTWRHSIHLEEAHLALSQLCITYLRFDDLRRDHHNDRQSSTRRENQEDFLDYSANHWIYHMQQVTSMDEDLVRKAAELCEVQNGPFSFWVYHNRSKWLWKSQIRRTAGPLFWAATWGVLQVIPGFLEDIAPDAEIPNDVVIAAARNKEYGEAVMKLLLGRRGVNVQITDELVLATAENRGNGEAIIRLLFDQRGVDVQITDELVLAAAKNKGNGEAIIRLLLDRRGVDVQITDELVLAAAKNKGNGEAIIRLLLDRRGVDVQITDELVLAAAKNKGNGEAVMKLLLDRQGADIKITDEVVIAAVKNEISGEAIMKLLLDRRGADIKIPNELVLAAAENRGKGEAVIKLLLDRRGADVKITDEVVIAAVKNEISGEAIMKLLLDRRGADIEITNVLVLAAVENRGNGEAMIKLLLDQQGADIEIADEVVIAAAENRFRGKAIMQLLLDTRGADFKITEEVVLIAANNDGNGEAIIRLLLDRRGADIQITNSVVLAAAKNLFSGEAVMKLLLDRRGADIKITDEVVIVAAENGGNGAAVIKLLFDQRGPDIQITDQVVLAAAKNLFSGEAVIKLLLDRRGADVKITDEVVLAAAANNESGEAVMKLLLDRRGADVKITDEVVLAAAANSESGEAVMKLLLDRRRADVKITDEVVLTAAKNEGNRELVTRLLLDRRGTDILITDEVVLAAVQNQESSEALMELLPT
ncbi:unnamed protein product [Penicillium salamii]|nr:unnamed protein product [Penicillium salamii]CAG8276030.1 unnamed protein product [Penicillium salamii]